MHDRGECCHDDTQRCQRVPRVGPIDQCQGRRHCDIGMHGEVLVVRMELTELLDVGLIFLAGLKRERELGVSGVKGCVFHD